MKATSEQIVVGAAKARPRFRRPRAVSARAGVAGLAAVFVEAALVAPAPASTTFLGGLTQASQVASTVPGQPGGAPGNGDLNPYGVAVVPHSVGHLVKGDVLVSNFNNAANEQGRGSTIVEIAPNGQRSVFARVPGRVGLTTALTVLRRGFVVVGSLATTDGTSATARAGGLIVLDSYGHQVETIAGGPINGPWDMAASDRGSAAVLFVTNVLNGTVAASPQVVNRGTVVRIDLGLGQGIPRVLAETVIGSGFAERTDPTALVVGPTGVGLAHDGTLYVADTLNSRVTAIPRALSRSQDAGTGSILTSGGAINGPLGLTLAPNGDILTVNGGDGDIVETTPGGDQVATKSLDATGSPAGAGALFGLALSPRHQGVYFVDDNTNTLDLISQAHRP